MAGLFFPPIQQDAEAQDDLQKQLEPSAGSVAKNLFKFDILDGPTGSLVKQHALNQAEGSGEKMSVEQLNTEYSDKLVKFDRPMSRGQAEIIRMRKQEEHERNDIFDRASGWSTTAGVSAMLAAGLVDPIGVVVGAAVQPARAINTLAGLRTMAASSSTKTRALGVAGLTAVDSAIGTAVLEPFVLYSHQQHYADYGMADSLANVVFGGVLGGGIGGGAVVIARGLSHVGDWSPDWLAGKKEATHDVAFRTAVAQATNGQAVDIELILASDPVTRSEHGDRPSRIEDAGPKVDESRKETDSLKLDPNTQLVTLEKVTQLKLDPNTQLAPSKKVPVTAKQEPLPATIQKVTLHRAVQSGTETVKGEPYFVSPDKTVATKYAGPQGKVTTKQTTLKSVLDARDLPATKKQLNLSDDATLQDVVYAARTAGYDGVALDTTNGREYVIIPKVPAKIKAKTGKEVEDAAKAYVEDPKPTASSDVPDDYDADAERFAALLAYAPAKKEGPAAVTLKSRLKDRKKTKKMVDLEQEIEYETTRGKQQGFEDDNAEIRHAEEVMSRLDDLDDAMAASLDCLLRN